jgi:poly-gamma-glutamate synthesis protein (capsule biosynthesis protein)
MKDDSLMDGLVAVGDIMLGDSATSVGFGFHSRYPKDAASAFAAVAHLLDHSEITIGNLECLLAASPPGVSRYRGDQMRGDPGYAADLRRCGFTALSVANNHAMQHGKSAFDATVRVLKNAGISCLGLRGTDGWCAEPVTQTTRSGLRVGLLGYSWRPRQYDQGVPAYAEGDVDAVIGDVARLRLETDTVVVSLHWGEEFLGSPSVREIADARRIVDAGASLIVGHHPHVARPIERYGSGVICYSLGNFVSDMIWDEALRTGVMLHCRLSKEGPRDVKVTTVHTDDSYRPVPVAAGMKVGDEPVTGMSEQEYRSAVALSVAQQRRRVYSYALRNVARYSPIVLAELAITTIRNKLKSA